MEFGQTNLAASCGDATAGCELGHRQKAADAQVSQPLRSADPRCTGWPYGDDASEDAHRRRQRHPWDGARFAPTRPVGVRRTRASWTGHMRALAPLLLAFAALGLAAAGARAQSPDKFERVAPPKAQPAAPREPSAAPLARTEEMRVMMRKAELRESEDGSCAKVPIGQAKDLDAFFNRAGVDDHHLVRLVAIRTFCEISDVASVSFEAGRKCILRRAYHCTVGGQCAWTLNDKRCRGKTGSWEQAK